MRIKIATEPAEFEQIYTLGHRTFVEEIALYEASGAGRFVDRFHDENTYVIALRGDTLAGMVAVRDRRPFSVEQRLPQLNLDSHLPPGRSICELRLLAVDPKERHGRLLRLLIAGTWHHCRRKRYDLAIISGITTRQRLYERLGFEPFGPLIRMSDAQFQPMMLTLERFVSRASHVFAQLDT